MGDKVKPDSHYYGGEAMRKVDLAMRGNAPDSLVKLGHGVTHLYRAVADGGNRAEYARGAGQIHEVLHGDYSLTAQGGAYQKNYGKK